MVVLYSRELLLSQRGGSAYARHVGVNDPENGLVALCNRNMILNEHSGFEQTARETMCRRCAKKYANA